MNDGIRLNVQAARTLPEIWGQICWGMRNIIWKRAHLG
mgnify:CR=1 FL=1